MRVAPNGVVELEWIFLFLAKKLSEVGVTNPREGHIEGMKGGSCARILIE